MTTIRGQRRMGRTAASGQQQMSTPSVRKIGCSQGMSWGRTQQSSASRPTATVAKYNKAAK